MYGKPLAYIVKIGEIREIPGADRIELASVMDYTVVVKKNEFKTGDLGLYVEVDSVLPDGLSPEFADKLVKLTQRDGDYATWTEDAIQAAVKTIMDMHKYPYFEFLRPKKFKIKSMKLGKFGVISQGILFKPEDVGLTSYKLGQDFTAQFEIRETVEDEEEAGLASQKIDTSKDGFILRFLMRFKWFRNLRKSRHISETWDPTHPGKSDEENVQKLYTRMYEKYKDQEWVATEKLEGQNITIFTEMRKKGIFGRKKKHVGVCSRTRELNPKGTGKNFWDTVKRLGLDKKIEAIPGEWFCRGEHVGPGIQKNIYKLDETDIIFFDFYWKEKYLDTTNGKKWKIRWNKLNYEQSVKFASEHGLKFVPVLDEHYKLPGETVNDKGVKVTGVDIMLQQSDKNTCFGKNLSHKREGFVLRLRDDYSVSFKVKNPNYSI